MNRDAATYAKGTEWKTHMTMTLGCLGTDMNAKYYTYRNLNYGTHFSTKYRGIVINYLEYAIIENGTFKVSAAGRERCLRVKKRNVHAFVTSDREPSPVTRDAIPALDRLTEVKYNPYKANTFVNSTTGAAIVHAEAVYLIDGRCFVDSR